LVAICTRRSYDDVPVAVPIAIAVPVPIAVAVAVPIAVPIAVSVSVSVAVSVSVSVAVARFLVTCSQRHGSPGKREHHEQHQSTHIDSLQ
jgi:hypothetical protein